MQGRFFAAACGLILVVSTNFSFAAKYKYSPQPLAPLSRDIEIDSDPLLKTSWHLDEMDVPEAWLTTQGDRSTVIAVVDSGANYNHPEISRSIFRNKGDCDFDGKDSDKNGFADDCVGWNFSEERSLPWDDNGHGTFIASIIAGAYNNDLGGAGVCPECSVMPIRFLDMDGYGDTQDAIRGIYYATKREVSVLSLSFAGEGYDQPLRNALKAAADADIVVIASAGNDGDNNDKEEVYPANFKMRNLITVAASRKDKDLWKFSNYGARRVTLAAPGVNIWGLWEDGKWYRSSGTSFAAPIVAGVVGLVRSANPKLKAEQVVDIIKATAVESRHLAKKVNTSAIINAHAAVACAIDSRLSCLK